MSVTILLLPTKPWNRDHKQISPWWIASFEHLDGEPQKNHKIVENGESPHILYKIQIIM